MGGKIAPGWRVASERPFFGCLIRITCPSADVEASGEKRLYLLRSCPNRVSLPKMLAVCYAVHG